MRGRGGEWVNWVLALPTFLRQSLSEDREVMVGGERRRVRKFVEVLQCRRCCGYGHGLYIARGPSVVRGVGVHTKLRTANLGIREHVWCVEERGAFGRIKRLSGPQG